MPKMKTNKGAKRRFKVTSTGKFLRPMGNKRHVKYGKAKRTLRGDDKTTEVLGGFRRKLRKVLPYGV